MAIKKYTNGSWVSASYRKYGTETDAITTLPATVIGDSTPISSYTIKGNMEQSGTPTPSSPIYPSECGKRTENLFDKKNPSMKFFGYINSLTNEVVASISNSLSIIVPVKPNSNYTISKLATTRFRVGLFANYPVAGSIATALYGDRDGSGLDYGSTLSFSTSTNTTYIMAFIRNYNDTVTENEEMQSVMVNEGSTAIPYEPYGYKLPLTSAGQSVDIYLGEVQSTRRIKKLVLTGEEYWTKFESTGAVTFYIKVPDGTGNIVLSTHFSAIWYGGLPLNNGVLYNGTTNKNMLFRMGDDTTITDVTSFKSFLAAQYANGTPVTVWYVLETPETVVVNEPIRKIGDYVDSVSGTNLATSGTAQELDVDTTLKPSELDLTYHGWHEHEDTKYST